MISAITFPSCLPSAVVVGKRVRALALIYFDRLLLVHNLWLPTLTLTLELSGAHVIEESLRLISLLHQYLSIHLLICAGRSTQNGFVLVREWTKPFSATPSTNDRWRHVDGPGSSQIVSGMYVYVQSFSKSDSLYLVYRGSDYFTMSHNRFLFLSKWYYWASVSRASSAFLQSCTGGGPDEYSLNELQILKGRRCHAGGGRWSQ